MDKERRQRLKDFVGLLRVDPGSKVNLAKDFDPAFKAGVKKKKAGVALLAEGVGLLSEYQARLASQDTWAVLVVLQALDAAGKDGAIRHVMSGVNPQGVAVHSFKVPSAEELDHDFLWRYAQRLPSRGQIGIFNRSHYEEVLVVRVHREVLDREKLPNRASRDEIWKQRYREINDWERYLTDNGIRIVKLFLNVSKEEQRTRLLRRIDLPDHNWKFSTADLAERELWSEYQTAFSEAISHTSTAWAPWHVIPADRKWFARIGTANVAAGLFQGFPVSTSGSRTAVAEQAGAKTQLTGVVGAAAIVLMLLLVPGLLQNLPQPTLAAVVIAASLSLADIPGTVRIWQRRIEFLLSIVAFLGVALIGVLQGIAVAVALSILNVFRRAWWPYQTTLGRVPGLPGHHDRLMHPEAEQIPGLVIFRFDAPLFFANVRTFRDQIRHLAAVKPTPRWIVIAAEPITDVDTTAADVLEDLDAQLNADGISLVFAELKDPVRAKLERYELIGPLDPGHFFPTINAAVESFRRNGDPAPNHRSNDPRLPQKGT